MMGKVHGWRTFAKRGAKFGYHLGIGPFILGMSSTCGLYLTYEIVSVDFITPYKTPELSLKKQREMAPLISKVYQ